MIHVKNDTITPAELAERIGVTVGTVNNWRVRNRGPRFVRIAGRVRYLKTDVEKWLDKEMQSA